MKRLDEFLKGLKEEVPEYEIPEYDEKALRDAIMDNKPELELEEVFGEAFYPKVERWLNNKLKKIKIPSDAGNYIGGEFKYKLDIYLKKDDEAPDMYEDSVETLARELLNSIEEWKMKVVKDPELPSGTPA